MSKRGPEAPRSALAELTPPELEQNRKVLAQRLQAEIREFESRYELPSADLEAAVARGELRETDDVATWVIAYRTLRALTDERQARAQ